MGKKVVGKSTIIGKDGPTSVFVWGKEKPKGLKEYIRFLEYEQLNRKYKRKRAEIKKDNCFSAYTCRSWKLCKNQISCGGAARGK